VLDDATEPTQPRLLLQRDFDHERALAQRLLQMAGSPPASAMVADAAARGEPAAADDPQAEAARRVLRQRLLLIAGGPGTGKTTTVARLLAALLQAEPGCRIALAAPTGKAAARMAEALQQRAATLPPALRAALPTQASTVHRLLGAGATPGAFAHHAGQPLPLDALVVDEASMLDLALARRLLDALPPAARLVLLGDPDQLAAVEGGAVFADLCSPGVADTPKAPLPGALLRLTGNHRFAADAPIGLLAQAVRQGRVDEALSLLRQAPAARAHGAAPAGPRGDAAAGPALAWHPPEHAAAQALQIFAPWFAWLRAMAASTWASAPTNAPADAPAYAQAHAPVHAPVNAPADSPTRALAAFAQARVLCAVRQGPQGVAALNAVLEQAARAQVGAAPGDTWYAGRPVLIQRNEPALGLFNGDIGIALPASAAAAAELRVWFADAQAEGGCRAVAPARLPAHDTAFAMTVHKSQGSEFDRVLLVLPQRSGAAAAGEASRVLTRELLYTAITRAREQVALAASEPVLRAAIGTPTRRDCGLRARLLSAPGCRGGSRV
jgi:exodeoxyribonuclease V alpha subunit